MARIVTLTLNPCIDLNLEVEEIAFETPLRAIGQRKRAGGKGVNVSEALAVLGVKSVAVMPVGGHSGDEFVDLAKSRLDPALVELKTIRIQHETRTNTVVTSSSDRRHIKVNQQGPELASRELEAMVNELDSLVGKETILAICGSMTPGLDKAFYQELVKRYKAKGAFVALDADGDAFRLGVRAKPDLVKPNRQELEMWAERDLTDDQDWYRTIAELVSQTEGICLATDGPNQAILASKKSAWSAAPLPASGSPVGAGDCSLAGLLSRIMPGSELDGPQALKTALACGTASASNEDTKGLRREQVDTIFEQMISPLVINLG